MVLLVSMENTLKCAKMLFRILWILFSFKNSASGVLTKDTAKWQMWQTWGYSFAIVQRNFMSWLGNDIRINNQ